MIKVLIVDDNAAIVKDITSILKRQKGLKIVGKATNGLQGIGMCERLQPDIVFLDSHMPKMTGPEAVNIIKRFSPNTKIILMSANGDPYYKELLKLHILDEYIDKNEMKKEIPRLLRRFVSKKLAVINDRKGDLYD